MSPGPVSVRRRWPAVRRPVTYGPTAVRVLLAVTIGLAAIAELTSGPASEAASVLVRIGPALPAPSGAVVAARLPSTAQLSIDIVLEPRHPLVLTAYARAVSTPSSGLFRHYLGVDQFVDDFGPSRHSIAAVEAALNGVGLHPGPIARNHLSIPLQASAQRLATAFSTRFTEYRESGGRIAYANTEAPQVPRSIASDIQAVIGLDDLGLAYPAVAHRSLRARREVATPLLRGSPSRPCRAAVRQASKDGSVTINRVAGAYGFSGIYVDHDLGSGETVALYELQGLRASDVAAYQSCYTTAASVSEVKVDGGPLTHSGSEESDVDTEEVASLTPDARILVYEGPNTVTGGYDTYSAIISQDAANVVSTSWGRCELFESSLTADAENTLFEEAAIQGQTIVASAGDQGSEGCLGKHDVLDQLVVDDPASQPFVTGVGGTSWSKAPPGESAWNDGPTCCWGAGGGGISSLWDMPLYQSNDLADAVINSFSSGAPCGAANGTYCREVPDVASLAGPYPFLFFVGGKWGSWGGTSLSSALWASLFALTDASAECDATNIGFANPVLYDIAVGQRMAFNDVTTGNNDLTGMNGDLFPALVGYDMATGLGTPNGSKLAAAICAVPVRQLPGESPGSSLSG